VWVTAVLNSDASDKKEEFIEVRKRTKTITSSDTLVEVEAEEGCEVYLPRHTWFN